MINPNDIHVVQLPRKMGNRTQWLDGTVICRYQDRLWSMFVSIPHQEWTSPEQAAMAVKTECAMAIDRRLDITGNYGIE